MQVLAINGSARKNGNSAAMLKHAIKGAEEAGARTELINLYELTYKGCTGCISCKLVGGKSFGRCAQRDDLTPVLEKAIDSNALFLASPIYFNDVTGELRSFLERFWYPAFPMTKERKPLYPKRIRVGMIFTTNQPAGLYNEYYNGLVRASSWLIGDTEYVAAAETFYFPRAFYLPASIIGNTEYVAAAETWQSDDYSRYGVDIIDVEARKRRHDEVFPQECKQAYEMGKRLATPLPGERLPM